MELLKTKLIQNIKIKILRIGADMSPDGTEVWFEGEEHIRWTSMRNCLLRSDKVVKALKNEGFNIKNPKDFANALKRTVQ